MVERIIHKILVEGIDVDRLLVVTFTNAAASEMRERVLDAIGKKIEENPDNEKLQRQINLLNVASICTIDSFCLEVIRNHFYELEQVSPNFRIADTSEIELLKQEILEDLFEEKYEAEEEDFAKLITTYTSYRDDTPLKDLILKIHQYISSSPFPELWLTEKVEMFNLADCLDVDFSQTPWGEILLQEMNDEVLDALAILQEVHESLCGDVELEPFKQAIASDLNQLENLKKHLSSWDESYQISQHLNFIAWPRKKVESEIKEEAKKVRDMVKKKLYPKLEAIFTADSRQANEELVEVYPILQKLQRLILEFKERFASQKRKKNIVDFGDVEHFALEILLKKQEDGTLVPSDVAKKYAEKFQEIAIDEYQDSNLVQEYILTSISRGNNIFMVGDVKQSIYKFRQAMPDLFLKKYREYSKIEDDSPRIGTKIQLFKNFRSRDNVLAITNLIFEHIMSENLGDVEYDEEEYLNFGAVDYVSKDQNIKTEITIITTEDSEEEVEFEEIKQEEPMEDIEVEARFIGQKVRELVEEKFQIYDRKKQIFRDICYRDIVILLRSTKNRASVIEQELIRLGIPVFSDSSQDYLHSMEIETMMSVLKIIDNPIQDIPMVTVLRSSIGGFTDDDLVQIRLSDSYDHFYDCMLKAKVNVEEKLREKIENFLNQLEKWCEEKEYLSLEELVWKICMDTGFYHYVGLMPNGMLRQANLKMLFEKAKQYQKANFRGLYHFIRFIEKLRFSSGDMSSAKIIGENDDVVRIMSIHKSKGLEFPIVFLANSQKQFNMQDIRKDAVLLHQELGIGVKYIDYHAQVQYDTLSREAIKLAMLQENLSEEMRILYVALTRAKEKIFITGTNKDFAKKMETIEKQVAIYPKEKGKMNPILVKKGISYLDWILMVYAYSKEASKDMLELQVIPKASVQQKSRENVEEQEKQEKFIWEHDRKISEMDLHKLTNVLQYTYPNQLATTIPTKTSVTELKHWKEKNDEKGQEEISLLLPEFLRGDEEEKLTASQKGTVMHLCMQHLDRKKDYEEVEVKELVASLRAKELLTEKEAESVAIAKIVAFTRSAIWKEIQEAKEVYQEQPFYIQVPAKEIYGEEIEESILVQGIIDLYYRTKEDKLILLDYKTDYVEEGKEQELVKRYKSQLELYKRALEQALDAKVDKVYIYSLYRNQVLEI